MSHVPFPLEEPTHLEHLTDPHSSRETRTGRGLAFDREVLFSLFVVLNTWVSPQN